MRGHSGKPTGITNPGRPICLTAARASVLAGRIAADDSAIGVFKPCSYLCYYKYFRTFATMIGSRHAEHES